MNIAFCKILSLKKLYCISCRSRVKFIIYILVCFHNIAIILIVDLGQQVKCCNVGLSKFWNVNRFELVIKIIQSTTVKLLNVWCQNKFLNRFLMCQALRFYHNGYILGIKICVFVYLLLHLKGFLSNVPKVARCKGQMEKSLKSCLPTTLYFS